jgi:hypothetical protein
VEANPRLDTGRVFRLRRRGTRLLGAALGSVVMLAATATVVVHGEHAHAILPIMILALLAIAGRTSRPIATIAVEQ